MASFRKKRKREIQDENQDCTDSAPVTINSRDTKRRKLDKERRESLHKEPKDGKTNKQDTALQDINHDNLPFLRRLSFRRQSSSRKSLRSNNSRESLPPAPVIPAGPMCATAPVEDMMCARTPTSTRFRRSLSGRGQKLMMSLRGTLRKKMAEQAQRTVMRNKQDYSLNVEGQMDYIRFLVALQDKQGHSVTVRDQYLQQKIDHEIRMRDGTAKLLAASKHPLQMLEAAKNLLASNSRMIAYMSELQKRKTDEVLKRKRLDEGNQEPCKGKLCVSDIRIPLMWKDSDHFKNKGDSKKYAVFCLVKIGTEIFDTALIKDVDKSMTDITFEDVLNFSDVPPDFECNIEVYCHQSWDLSIASTPRKLRKKLGDLSGSVGRSVGRRLSGLKEDPDVMSSMIVGPKYEMLAHARLRLRDVSDAVGTHDLVMEASSCTASDSVVSELPLFGHYCCRLAAQPYCLTRETTSGYLHVQGGSLPGWQRLWCALKDLRLSCWESQEATTSASPICEIPVTKETQICDADSKSSEKQYSFHISSHKQRAGARGSLGHWTLAAESKQQLSQWWEGLQQHMLDQALWQHACENKMEIKQGHPNNQAPFFRKGSQPLYDSVNHKQSRLQRSLSTEGESPMSKVLNRLCLNEEVDTSDGDTRSQSSHGSHSSGSDMSHDSHGSHMSQGSNHSDVSRASSSASRCTKETDV